MNYSANLSSPLTGTSHINFPRSQNDILMNTGLGVQNHTSILHETSTTNNGLFKYSTYHYHLYVCDRYDVDGFGTINGEKMMQKLGVSINSQGESGPTSPPHSANQGEQTRFTYFESMNKF